MPERVDFLNKLWKLSEFGGCLSQAPPRLQNADHPAASRHRAADRWRCVRPINGQPILAVAAFQEALPATRLRINFRAPR
jgi:hypothetical protein